MRVIDSSTGRNKELRDIFQKMADCYRYLGGEHQFRAAAYDAAAKALGALPKDIGLYIDSDSKVNHPQGIGDSIAEKIREYIKTGSITAFEELKMKAPLGLVELMDINGLGPVTIQTLHNRLGISNRAELIAAIGAGRLPAAGLSDKKIENIKHGLKLYKNGRTRMQLWEALLAGGEMLRAIEQTPEAERAVLAGSLRRWKESIGDIDIVAQADEACRKKLALHLAKLPQAKSIIASGNTRVSLLLNENDIQVDVRMVDAAAIGAALLYFTGSVEHTIKLRTLAKEKGYKLNEYGLFDAGTGAYIAGSTEEEIYSALGLQYIAPEMREGNDELELASRRQVPPLVSFNYIKGDMHVHSLWSDGNETIGNIARYVQNAFSHYEYIVITDHSSGNGSAGRLRPDDFVRQAREIAAVNERSGSCFVKQGIEVNILEDGSLDLPDEQLRQFDWVIAAIHSGYNRDNTERLLSACRHPLVNCIGHPSGRLTGSRDSYPVNWERVLTTAAATGTALEINAQPQRLDLGSDLVRMVVRKGGKLVISTDSHTSSHFDYMQLGIGIARRAGCRREDILNTQHWDAIESFKKKKRGSDLR